MKSDWFKNKLNNVQAVVFFVHLNISSLELRIGISLFGKSAEEAVCSICYKLGEISSLSTMKSFQTIEDFSIDDELKKKLLFIKKFTKRP